MADGPNPTSSEDQPNLHVTLGPDGPEGPLPPGVTWDAKNRNVILDSAEDATLIVDGDGAGNAVRTGDGKGDAVRAGAGDGHAWRSGNGNGHAERYDHGSGNAVRDGTGEGDAWRGSSGPGNAVNTSTGRGNALREDEGHGDALRSGPARGNAERSGRGDGNAARIDDGTGRARRSGAGKGDAIRDGVGAGQALRSGAGHGDARRAGAGAGNAERSDGGRGSAFRTGPGAGDAVRFDNGPGHAIRSDGGPGNAYRRGDGPGQSLTTPGPEPENLTVPNLTKQWRDKTRRDFTHPNFTTQRRDKARSPNSLKKAAAGLTAGLLAAGLVVGGKHALRSPTISPQSPIAAKALHSEVTVGAVRNEFNVVMNSMLKSPNISPETPLSERRGAVPPEIERYVQKIDDVLGGGIKWPDIHITDLSDQRTKDNERAAGAYARGGHATLAPGIHLDKAVVAKGLARETPQTASGAQNETRSLDPRLTQLIVHELQHATSHQNGREIREAARSTWEYTAYDGTGFSEARADVAEHLYTLLEKNHGSDPDKLNKLDPDSRTAAVAQILRPSATTGHGQARTREELLVVLKDENYLHTENAINLWDRHSAKNDAENDTEHSRKHLKDHIADWEATPEVRPDRTYGRGGINRGRQTPPPPGVDPNSAPRSEYSPSEPPSQAQGRAARPPATANRAPKPSPTPSQSVDGAGHERPNRGRSEDSAGPNHHPQTRPAAEARPAEKTPPATQGGRTSSAPNAGRRNVAATTSKPQSEAARVQRKAASSVGREDRGMPRTRGTENPGGTFQRLRNSAGKALRAFQNRRSGVAPQKSVQDNGGAKGRTRTPGKAASAASDSGAGRKRVTYQGETYELAPPTLDRNGKLKTGRTPAKTPSRPSQPRVATAPRSTQQRKSAAPTR